MKNLSIFQLILLIVFGVFAIIGVLVFAIAVGGNKDSVVGEVQIWGTLNGEAFSEVVARAGDADANLKGVTYIEKDPATYESELTNALAVGAGPDLFILRQDYAEQDAGKTLPFPPSLLTAAQFQSAYADAASPYLTGAGILALPFLADPLVLYWNRDILNAGGIAKPPSFWDEVLAIAQNKNINIRDNSGGVVKSAIALGEYSNVDNAKDILSALILQSGGGITERDGGGKLIPSLAPQSGSSARGAESALRFFTQFADPSKDYYSWSRGLENSRSAFASGDLALYVGFASEEPVIRRMNPNLSFSIAPMLQVREGGKISNSARVYAFAVSRAAKNPAGAQVVAGLLSAPAVSKEFSAAFGMPSASRDVLAMPAEGNKLLANREVLIARSWVDPEPAKTADIFRDMIGRVSSGRMQVAESVQRANEELEAILGR